jgi:hypothetical protein
VVAWVIGNKESTTHGLIIASVDNRHKNIITLRFHLSVNLCICPYEREVTGSHLTGAKTFSFPASLDLGHYNRQPTDTTGYGPDCN